jgi:chemotaxis protein MotB
MRHRSQPNLSIDYWPSLTDVLMSVMLVLILLVSIFVVTQTGLLETLGVRESALAQLSQRLAALESQLSLSRKQTTELTGELTQARADLESLTSQAEAKELALAGTTKALGQTSQTLRLAISNLAATSATLGKSRASLAAELAKGKLLSADIEAKAADIRRLTDAINEYMKKIETLNQQLSSAEQNVKSKDASLADLNATAEKLAKQIEDLTKKLGEAEKEVSAKKLDLTKLMDQLKQRENEIARLKGFEKYKSEFLAKLADVFGGAKNIRVVGDRFVFQGEVLFGSGSAELTETGKSELGKFVQTYKSLETRIPKDINLNIQVQGHTDSDPIASARFPDNWELSVARALRVVRYLNISGIPDTRLSAAGYSQYQPLMPDDSPAAKAQNRRIEILITQR